MPQIGEVLYVKTSEEPVLVLGTRKVHDSEIGKKFPEIYHGSGEVVTVRRPIQTSEGLTYMLYDFLAEELETETQQNQRLYSKLVERQKLAQAEFGMPTIVSKPS